MCQIFKFIFSLTLLGSVTNMVYGQSKPLMGQYFQNIPAFAPALTGANDFLDLRLSVRKQWVGFEGAPETYYLSGYGAIKSNVVDNYRTRSLRLGVSGVEEPKPKRKHGVGGYLQSDKQGAFSIFDFNLNYAVHVPLFKYTFLSLGISAGFSTEKVDVSKISVKDKMDDPTYQSYIRNGLSNTYFNAIAGIALNSDRYYISYSAMPLVSGFLGGNEVTHGKGSNIRHQVMLGNRFYLSQDAELIPNAFIRIDKTMPLLYDAGVRFRYLQKYWAGVSFRNNETIIGMLGFVVNDLWKFSYAYEYGMGDFSTYNNGTHEIVIGVQLFNYKKYSSMW